VIGCLGISYILLIRIKLAIGRRKRFFNLIIKLFVNNKEKANERYFIAEKVIGLSDWQGTTGLSFAQFLGVSRADHNFIVNEVNHL
jgi:hypothetical protein